MDHDVESLHRVLLSFCLLAKLYSRMCLGKRRWWRFAVMGRQTPSLSLFRHVIHLTYTV